MPMAYSQVHSLSNRDELTSIKQRLNQIFPRSLLDIRWRGAFIGMEGCQRLGVLEEGFLLLEKSQTHCHFLCGRRPGQYRVEASGDELSGGKISETLRQRARLGQAQSAVGERQRLLRNN